MTAAELSLLLAKLRDQAVSPEERRYLMDMVEKNILVQLETESEIYGGWTPEKEETILSSILSNIKSAPRSRIFSIQKYRWIAASLFLILSAGTYFLIVKNQSQPRITQNKAVEKDISPGDNRAVLTLGDGTTIVLDSAANGSLATQGNASILKTDNNRLTYNLSKEKPTEIVFNTLSTPRGGQYQLSLPDGSKVWLNAASSITYPTAFGGKERKVTVTGEVYFEVIHNPKQPFRVSVGGQLIEDIGTSFNVNSYTDESTIQTTLIEGRIKVKYDRGTSFLKPGQQSNLTESGIRISNYVDLEKVIAWKNGVFDFQDVKLEAAMRQLSRWYNINVIYEKGIPDIEFVGKIKRDLTLGDLLHFLEESRVHFRIEQDRKLIVTP